MQCRLKIKDFLSVKVILNNPASLVVSIANCVLSCNNKTLPSMVAGQYITCVLQEFQFTWDVVSDTLANPDHVSTS